MASATLLAAASGLAQTAPGNAGLPRLDEIEPLAPVSQAGLHNIEVSIEQAYARAENLNQPTQLDQKSMQTSIGVSADLGEFVAAGVTGTYSHEAITSTNLAFAMPMAGTANVVGADAFVTVKPLPFLHIGALGGIGSAAASYEFTGLGFSVPSTPGNSSTRRLGAFLSAFYGADRLLVSGTATVLNIATTVDYGPTNVPQSDSFGSTLLLTRLGVAYALTDALTVAGGVTVNQVLSQQTPAAQTGLDDTWMTLEGGVAYALTPQFSIRATVATWLWNERMNFTRAAVGAVYRF